MVTQDSPGQPLSLSDRHLRCGHRKAFRVKHCAPTVDACDLYNSGELEARRKSGEANYRLWLELQDFCRIFELTQPLKKYIHHFSWRDISMPLDQVRVAIDPPR